MVAVAAKSASGQPAKNGYDGDAGEAAGETVNTQA
jgi:hypothetical protein